MRSSVLLTLILLSVAVRLLAQSDIYIAASGNDGAAGTLQQPLRTLHKAVEKASGLQGADVKIWMRGGIYYLNSTVRLSSDNARFRSLHISAYRQEAVTISGAAPVRPQWETYRRGILKAGIKLDPVPDRLYLNGRALPMARYPDYDSTARVFNGTAADAMDAARVLQWQHPAGGYVHALHAGEWGGFHYRITGKNSAQELQLEGGWQNNRPSPLHKKYRFVENIFEELNAPGEWYYDASAQQLYLYPPAGIPLQSATLTAGKLDQLIALEGSAGKPLKNITITHIRFTQTNRTFMRTREPLLRSDWTIFRGGAIFCRGTENITISDCRLDELGGNAIFCSNYNRQVHIKDNHLFNIGASALAFVGSAAAVRSPAFRYELYVPWDSMDYTPGPGSNDYPQECTASGNLIHDIGLTEKQGAGVQIEMAAGIEVIHNTIYNLPRAGINIGDGCWGGHLIAFNDVFNTVQETGDHGAFNSWGRDRFWRPDRKVIDSIVRERPGIRFLDAVRPTVIRNNRFYCAHGWDIDLDDGSSNYIIENNVCLSGGLKLREGYRRIVRNNILINNTFHPHVWLANSEDVFTGNIVSSPYAPIGMEHWGQRIDSNFFLLASALDAARQLGLEAHGASIKPPFTDPQSGNYTLQQASPAFTEGFSHMENNFGVTAPRLKSQALPAPRPVLLAAGAVQAGEKKQWLGATIKNIESLGERSAAGLPDQNGVLVLAVEPGSMLDKSGLKKGDVVTRLGEGNTHTVTDLLQIYQQVRWRGTIEATIVRNQAAQSIQLTLK